MMTCLEMINRLENGRNDYDDEVVFVRPAVGAQAEYFEIVDVHRENGEDGDPVGRIYVVLSKQ